MLATSEWLFAVSRLHDTLWGQVIILIGLFVLGTIFGSFANVVVFRLPRKKSLMWPPSHCPQCKHPIRWYDNIPILGWILLQGKCRDCKAPISTRYLFVETLFGIILATIGWLEIVEQHANLPLRPIASIVEIPPSDWILVGYHMLLVGTLVCAALIEQDEQPLLRRLPLFTIWVGLVLPLVWNALRPIPLRPELPELLRVSSTLLGLVEGVAGLVAGVLLACLAWPATATVRFIREGSLVLVYELMMIGIFLGWQAVCAIAAITLLLALLGTLVSNFLGIMPRVGWSALLAGVTFVWISFWSTIVTLWPWLGKEANLGLFVVCGTVVLASALLIWRVGRPAFPRAVTS